MNNNKVIKILIGIVIIIIIIIAVCLGLLNKDEDANETSSNTSQNEEGTSSNVSQGETVTTVANSNVEETTEASAYFVVKDVLSSYYSYCKKLNTTEEEAQPVGLELEGEELEQYVSEQMAAMKEEGQSGILGILDDSYISEYGITEDNVTEKFGLDYEYKVVIQEMHTVQDTDNVNTYIVNGFLVEVIDKGVTNFNMAVNLDTSNETFSIYPQEYLEEHEYTDISEGDNVEIDIKTVRNKIYNTYDEEEIDDSDICKEYYNNYKYAMLYNTEYSYQMLGEEYREERFGSYEEYNTWIESNFDRLKKCIVSQYQVTESNGLTEYTCVDNYGNYYVITQYSMSNYSLELDTYTIKSDEFLTKYDSGSDETKAGMNVEIFFEALNRRDYDYIYEHLADSFKNNYYQTQESFEEYMENNLYDYNNKDYVDYNLEGNLHIFELTVLNQDNEAEQKTMNVIIQLDDELDFVMSFSIES